MHLSFVRGDHFLKLIHFTFFFINEYEIILFVYSLEESRFMKMFCFYFYSHVSIDSANFINFLFLFTLSNAKHGESIVIGLATSSTSKGPRVKTTEPIVSN